MSIRTAPWPAGTPCWVELATPDVRAAHDLYRAVLGWDAAAPDDTRAPDDATAAPDGTSELSRRVIATKRGAATAAIGPLPSPDAAPAWTLSFATDDAAATATAITEAGGHVLLGPVDVTAPDGVGAPDDGSATAWSLVATDPSGAVFGAWQAGTRIGAALVNEPGGLVWEDLTTPDPTGARTFYSAVFGWRWAALPEGIGGSDMAGYTMFLPSAIGDDAPLGGVDGTDLAGPARWLATFAVDDADLAAATVLAAGGTVVEPPEDTDFGRFAVLDDPAGARFGVITITDTTDPQRP